jgi:NADH:ubiquinone oxidoreductase subunit H
MAYWVIGTMIPISRALATNSKYFALSKKHLCYHIISACINFAFSLLNLIIAMVILNVSRITRYQYKISFIIIALHHAYIFSFSSFFVELSLRQSYYPIFGTKDCSSFIASQSHYIIDS